jgi:hypothetical protein
LRMSYRKTGSHPKRVTDARERAYDQVRGKLFPGQARMRFTRTTRAAGSNGIAYYKGRRIDAKDRRQIKRWKAMRRHVRQIERHCEPGDLLCRARQRQALLHWAYDSRKV